MDRILKILKKENAPRASSAPALELNTIIFKHVYGYMQQISGERSQDQFTGPLVLWLYEASIGRGITNVYINDPGHIQMHGRPM